MHRNWTQQQSLYSEQEMLQEQAHWSKMGKAGKLVQRWKYNIDDLKSNGVELSSIYTVVTNG